METVEENDRLHHYSTFGVFMVVRIKSEVPSYRKGNEILRKGGTVWEMGSREATALKTTAAGVPNSP